MVNSVKSKIYQMLDEIKDETILNQVMEDVAFYASKKDITDDLAPEQIDQLNAAIKQADNNETISLDDFKKEMSEWKKK
jgi:hypothetical protein